MDDIQIELCDYDEDIGITSVFTKLAPNKIDYASFTCMRNEKKRRYYFSNREWGQVCIDKKYVLYDPVVKLALNVKPLFFSWKNVSYDQDNRIIDEERKKYVKICSAYTMMIDRDGSFLSLASSNEDFDFPLFFKENGQKAFLFGKICHRVLRNG